MCQPPPFSIACIYINPTLHGFMLKHIYNSTIFCCDKRNAPICAMSIHIYCKAKRHAMAGFK